MASTDLKQEEAGVWTTGPDGELIPDYESTFPTINEGEVVHGTVVRVDKDEVLVDIGYKSEGVIPVSELSIRRSVNPADEVSVGDEIDALVMTKEDAEGRLILSKKRARFELAWKAIERAAESGEPVTGRVIEVVKGGLIHISELSWSHVNHPSEVLEIGQTVKVKVLDIDRERQRISLGLKQTQTDPWQQVLEQYKEGDVVEVLILEVDAERRRLSLSLKRVDAERRAEAEAPIEGTPHLDLSEDVFSDSAAAPALPRDEDAPTDAPPAAEDAVEREASVNPGDEVDQAAADEAAAAEPASDEH